MASCRDLHSSFLAKRRGCVNSTCGVLLLIALLSASAEAQNTEPRTTSVTGGATRSGDFAGTELSRGISLTQQGRFKEAVPFLQQARNATESYAADFNLALCYLGMREFRQAIVTLNDLRVSGYDTAAMNNLLAQAYIGDGQHERAFQALKDASRQTPKDERLYAFVADACTDHYAYGLGLRVVDLGMRKLPDSARLHYERAVFLARLDRLEEAKPEFQIAARLALGSDIGYLALIQEKLYEERFADALTLAREGIKAGHRDYQMLALLGTILMHEGGSAGPAGVSRSTRRAGCVSCG